jgi:hypothetical protein
VFADSASGPGPCKPGRVEAERAGEAAGAGPAAATGEPDPGIGKVQGVHHLLVQGVSRQMQGPAHPSTRIPQFCSSFKLNKLFTPDKIYVSSLPKRIQNWSSLPKRMAHFQNLFIEFGVAGAVHLPLLHAYRRRHYCCCCWREDGVGLKDHFQALKPMHL